MSSYIQIKKLANGFELECNDPNIVKENQKKDTSWKNPNVAFAFSTIEEVLKFVKDNMSTIFPEDTFSKSFAKFAKEAEKEK